MFQMKYTNYTVIKSSDLKTGIVQFQDPTKVFNNKGGDYTSIKIRNMFERVRSGNDNCGYCGGFKHGF